ncbi:MAG TPA: hypothetical protein VJ508_19780 [Saprospiraceae bacterium]|nr:hypothetical protein [Saprospiraceae bacterium]
MTRLKALSPEEAPAKTKELFDAINAKFGMIPNMMRTMGNSTAFLKGYLNLSDALSAGTLGAKNGASIALAVAETNSCNYCLSAHTYLGANLARLDAKAMEAARLGSAEDPKTNAILKFAITLVKKTGKVDDADIAAVRKAGVTEGEIGEIIGHVALNILTNYLNNTAKTEIDFPVVTSLNLAHAGSEALN